MTGSEQGSQVLSRAAKKRHCGKCRQRSHQRSIDYGELESSTAGAIVPSTTIGNASTRQPFTPFSPGSQTGPVQHNPSEAPKVLPQTLRNAFFIGYFFEKMVSWFAVLDFQQYFAQEFIVLCSRNPLLQTALSAPAAKHLEGSFKSNPSLFTSPVQQNIVKRLTQENPDLSSHGTQFYDKAIWSLARPIDPSPAQISQSSPNVNPDDSLMPNNMMTRAKVDDIIERLLATCACIQYQHLCGNSRAFSQHLNDFDKLLTLLSEGGVFSTNPLTHQIFNADSQKAIRAAFWWWTINDLEESFVSCRKLRVDTEDLPLWIYMGLPLGDDDNNDEDVPDPETPLHLQEEQLSFVLIRSLCKLINSITKALTAAQATPQPRSQQTPNTGACINVAEFQPLQRDIDKCQTRVRTLLQPAHTLRAPDAINEDPDIFGYELWYSRPSRAVTLLYNYMARILLLIHQSPSLLIDSRGSKSSSLDLLLALRDVEFRLRRHALRIISITNGMLGYDAVRIRAIQPLYVAGRALTDNHDRKRLIEMLRSIQDDLGVDCEYRVKDLMKEWKIPFEALELRSRSAQSAIPIT